MASQETLIKFNFLYKSTYKGTKNIFNNLDHKKFYIDFNSILNFATKGNILTRI